MDFLKARQRIGAGRRESVKVSPILISALLHIGDEVSDVPGIQARLWEHLWREDADLFDFVILIRRHQLDAESRRDASGGYPT